MSSSSQNASLKPHLLPRNARISAIFLSSLGAQSAEEGVLPMLTEFASRCTTALLTDAMSYAEHARGSGSSLTKDDILLAIQYRNEGSATGSRGGPSKELLLSLANTINSIPLPILSQTTLLPPPRDRLTNPNFEIVPMIRPGEKRKREQEEEEQDAIGEVDDADGDAQGEDDDEEMEMDEVVPGQEEEGADKEAGKRVLVEDDDYD